ncbi:MAG TPA: hypothetical protein VFP71_03040 [Candidatus Angelobacter sp.]|nr:hypothetical protein [Candidatus Angelobacter sp.]
MIIRFSDLRYWDAPDGNRYYVKDAPRDMLPVPSHADIKGSIPRSATECMYARWLLRQGAKYAFVNQGNLYGVFPDSNGKYWLMRWISSGPAKKKIKQHDALRSGAEIEEKIPPHSVWFYKPTGWRTLEKQRLAQALHQVKKDRERRRQQQRGVQA